MMQMLSDPGVATFLLKALWLLSVAGGVFAGVKVSDACVRASGVSQALEAVTTERDEARRALSASQATIEELERRLALQSDSLRPQMAAIEERLAETRRAQAREARLETLRATDPRLAESRCEAATRMIDEALKESRTWSAPR
jgi:chromosome segregation ATPase